VLLNMHAAVAFARSKIQQCHMLGAAACRCRPDSDPSDLDFHRCSVEWLFPTNAATCAMPMGEICSDSTADVMCRRCRQG
jgi:hypothetical protein